MSCAVRSAGLLPYRHNGTLEVLIAHPGGPWFAKRDAGSWSVVKGLVKDGEEDHAAAIREFQEETGWQVPSTEWIPLGETTLKSRKVIIAWGVEASFDLQTFNPGTFTIYGREYPEIDRVVWMTAETAREKLNPAQIVFVERLEAELVTSDL